MMKKVLQFVLFVTLLSISSACSLVVDEEEIKEEEIKSDDLNNYTDLKEWFGLLCSEELGGRYSGSEGISKAVGYLSGIIGESDSLEIDTFPTDVCEMKNLIFHIKGLNDSLVVLGAHYDAYGYKNSTPYPGADDNLSGTAVLLSVIKSIQKNKIQPKYSVDICLFDGEEIGRYGSRHYISICHQGIKQYINVDTCGRLDCGIELLHSVNGSLLGLELEGYMAAIIKYVGEYKPIGYSTDCDPFGAKQIPFVFIHNEIGSPDYLHSVHDDTTHISFEKLSIISNGLDAYLRSI